jgi:hypothetical protein
MRVVGYRKKKLIVAFHFYLFSNPAGWKCDACRKAGLQTRRRCGWSAATIQSPERVVWARKGMATTVCPKALITAQSLAWLEEFLVRRKLDQPWPEELRARDAEAFLILEAECEVEARDGRR